MATPGLSRKRPAPGTSPDPFQNLYPTPSGQGTYNGFDTHVSNDQFLQFGYQAQVEDPQIPDSNASIPTQSTHDSELGGGSNQLARRPANQIMSRDRGSGDSRDLQWTEQGNAQRLDGAWGDNLDELKQRALVAKRESQAKRKQIPPFVQKIASFLDDGKNTNLIRWSDDGNSFIVEDEDEFAKKLIPELFKHNNYASFVRQLNMYGFHKKVGLSDNSMRASEKKAKSPSEYSNPYFRRGHPDLLWLIQKPRNVGQNAKPKGSKRIGVDPLEDENDDFFDEMQSTQQTQKPKPRGQLGFGPGDTGIPSDQLANVNRELRTIRSQQSQIAAMLQRLKREHEQLYGQAANFQDQHSRHENSINAILTFLATVYHRSLQGHEGVPGITNLFTGTIPQDSDQSHVVDVGDYTFDQLNGTEAPMQAQYKKPPLLLKGPPADVYRSSTSPSPGGSPYEGPPPRQMSQARKSGLSPSDPVGEVLEMHNSQQPGQTANPSDRQDQNDILSVIHNTNARNSTAGTPAADFINILNSLESSGGGSPLTNIQRADMLRLINGQESPRTSGDNALTSPHPPPIANNYSRRLAATKSDLEYLSKMQADQDRSVQNLTNLLRPLSPTGSIPGLANGTEVPPPPLDIDDFLSSCAGYMADFPPDQDLGLGGTEPQVNGINSNGLNFADAGDGDDELFCGVGSSNNNNKGANELLVRNGSNGYDYLNVDGAADGGGGAGRVESMGSSDGASPTNSSATWDDDGTTIRSRTAAGPECESWDNPAKKRKRVS